MSTRDPSPLAILSARLAKAYPYLSPFLCASLAEELSSIERAQRRHAERCCSGEDGGYTKLHTGPTTHGAVDGIRRSMTFVHDPEAEQRAGARIEKRVGRWEDNILAKHALASDWSSTGASPFVTLQGDPRGRVLLVRFPGELEASSA